MDLDLRVAIRVHGTFGQNLYEVLKFKMMRSSTTIGKAGEYLVAYEFSKLGFAAFVNPDPASPFDVIVSFGNKFLTVQVKATTKRVLKKRLRCRPGLSPYWDKQVVYAFSSKGDRYENVDLVAYVALDISKVLYLKSPSLGFKRRFGVKNFEKLAEGSLQRAVERIMCS